MSSGTNESGAPVDVTSPAVPKAKKKRKTTEIAVRLARVTRTFGAKVAVDDVSLKIKSGSVYGLIGPNGAGKTTTFSMLAGYLRPTQGEVEILGFGPTQVDELRSRVGVLPQDALLPASDKVGEFLLHMARLQNIPREKADAEARAVLAEVDGRDWWNQRCGSLSHGMAKRVAYEVRQLIKARKGRCTLIVSSHNLQELEEICDGAAILDRGKLVTSGTIGELTAASEEIHVKLSGGPVPIAQVRELAMVKRVEFDDERRELVVYFERSETDAETVIGATLWVLLNNQARISAVTKGRGLEQRVMEMTA
jgi:ABC-2 type transport system ATP-binding protein